MLYNSGKLSIESLRFDTVVPTHRPSVLKIVSLWESPLQSAALKACRNSLSDIP